MNKFLLSLLLVSQICLADEAFLGYGVGIFNDANYELGQNKYLELGVRYGLWDGLYLQLKGGLWGESSPDRSRTGGGWLSSGLGLEVNLNAVEIRSGWGLAAISSPDSQLGGNFPQFNGELYLGLRDKKGDGIGLQVEHISCASFCNPNVGRDFVTLQLSQKW